MKLSGNMSEAGELHGVSRWQIQKWVRQGLPYVPEGRKAKRIVFSELEKWLISRQVVVKGRL